jgi:hypothetical protein
MGFPWAIVDLKPPLAATLTDPHLIR